MGLRSDKGQKKTLVRLRSDPEKLIKYQEMTRKTLRLDPENVQKKSRRHIEEIQKKMNRGTKKTLKTHKNMH